MTTSPSGEQWTLRHGRQEATVVEVGGGLRTYRVDGTDVVAGYADDEVCRAGRGQVLMPWPNRIRDGKYTFGGTDHQLGLTEPALHNANHGLVRWATWQLHWHSDDWSALTVRTRLHPQPGWDGILDLSVNYVLEPRRPDRQRARDQRRRRARRPFGFGAHPYIALGETPLAEVELDHPRRARGAGRRPADPDRDRARARRRGLPDRSGRWATTALDTAFTELPRSATDRRVGGRRRRPRRPATSRVWGDESLDWVQVFTAKGRDTGVDGVRGIAVEPMSCPANAFNSGDGLVVLEPGQSWSGTWGIEPAALS